MKRDCGDVTNRLPFGYITGDKSAAAFTPALHASRIRDLQQSGSDARSRRDSAPEMIWSVGKSIHPERGVLGQTLGVNIFLSEDSNYLCMRQKRHILRAQDFKLTSFRKADR